MLHIYVCIIIYIYLFIQSIPEKDMPSLIVHLFGIQGRIWAGLNGARGMCACNDLVLLKYRMRKCIPFSARYCFMIKIDSRSYKSQRSCAIKLTFL